MAFKLADRQKVSVAIVISLAFFLCEIVVAFKTGSLALMADAFHYLNDLVGFVVTLVSIVITEKTEYRQDFSFGWQRARLLGAFFNGAFLLALGVSIFLQSIERFISLKEVSEVKLILIMGCVGLGLNIITAAFLHDHHGHHHDHHHADADSETNFGTEFSPICIHSDHAQSECRSGDHAKNGVANYHANHRHVNHAIKAPGRDLGMMGAMLHVLGDALNNVGVILAAVIIWFTSSPGRFYADPAVGMGISLMILFSAIPLVKHSGEILLQSAPQGVNINDIKHDIEKIPGITSVHELHVWRLDQHKAIASAHVVVAEPDIAAFMAKAKTIRECLHAYGIHSTTLQPELYVAPPPRPAAAPEPSATPGMGMGMGAAAVGVVGDEEDVVGGGAASSSSSSCQIVCGRGKCDHLMCCNTLVQL